MKKIALLLGVALAGCTSTAPQPKATVPLPPMPPGVAAQASPVKAKTLAVRRAATFSAIPKAAGMPALRDAHVVGYTPDYGFWNGTGFDVTVPDGVQIFVPNPTASTFIKVDWSPDLAHWTSVGYFTNFTQGIWLVDPSAGGAPMRFYRVQALTP